jgi:hypothetical protein
VNANDHGAGSLRDTIAAAGADTIVFDPSLNGQTITLTSGPLSIIAKDLNIQGPGANLLTISGNHTSRVFRIGDFRDVNVTIAGLTIANGQADLGGGGIGNAATLAVTGCTFSSNSAGDGGGIENRGFLAVTNCTLSGNSARSVGGGIDNALIGEMTLTNCTLFGNVAGSVGGAIANLGGLTVLNSTLSGNSASIGGGFDAAGGRLTVANTIIAGNTAPSGPDVFGAVTSRGHNLVGDRSRSDGFTPSLSDLQGTAANPLDPRLGPLQDNGGPTPTMALLPGSPARGAGSNALAVGPGGIPLTTDQRGFARVVDGAVDVGAFEVQHYVVTTTADSGPGSLRDALTNADQAGGSDVTFAVSGTITLQSALPDVRRSTRIFGPAASLTVQRSPAAGTPAFRVFTVDGPAGAFRDVSVSLSGLTIANGQAAALAAGGASSTRPRWP